MTRAEYIEQAARELLASMDLNGYVAPGFHSELALRAALATRADANNLRALVERWREDSHGFRQSGFEECADELEAVLDLP